jgi:peptidylprolyl isomerase
MRKTVLLALTACLAAAPAMGQGQGPDALLRASPKADWRTIDPANTLYMDLPQGRVTIELAPAFAPKTVANIKTLVKQGFFDGLVIDRLQEAFVAQWGDPEADGDNARAYGAAKKTVPPEFSRANLDGLQFTPWPDRDTYAESVGFVGGMPVARDPKTGNAWLAYCPGMVGVARDTDPASGSGGELFTVIGPPARKMDRNVTAVGWVVNGLPILAKLKPGSEPGGFYKPADRTPIIKVRLAADVPVNERSPLEALRADSQTFTTLAEMKRTGADSFYRAPPGAVALCDAPLVVRAAKP